MAEEKFDENLMRMIAGELAFLVSMTVAREMFGKSYFSLGVPEKAAVDQTVIANVGSNFQAITPAFLAGQQSQQSIGFGVPAAGPMQEKKS